MTSQVSLKSIELSREILKKNKVFCKPKVTVNIECMNIQPMNMRYRRRMQSYAHVQHR